MSRRPPRVELRDPVDNIVELEVKNGVIYNHDRRLGRLVYVPASGHRSKGYYGRMDNGRNTPVTPEPYGVLICVWYARYTDQTELFNDKELSGLGEDSPG